MEHTLTGLYRHNIVVLKFKFVQNHHIQGKQNDEGEYYNGNPQHCWLRGAHIPETFFPLRDNSTCCRSNLFYCAIQQTPTIDPAHHLLKYNLFVHNNALISNADLPMQSVVDFYEIFRCKEKVIKLLSVKNENFEQMFG